LTIGGGGGQAEVTVTNSTLVVREDPAFVSFGSGSVFVADGNPATIGTLTFDSGSVGDFENDIYISYQDGVSSLGSGRVTVCNSTLNAREVFVGQNGTLAGTTVNGNVTVEGGTVGPGCSPGTLTVNGDVIFSGGELVIEIAGEGLADLLNVTGMIILQPGTTIRFSFQNGFAPSAGDSFDFLQAEEIILPPDPSDIDLEFDGLLEDFEFDVSNAGTGFKFTANTDGEPDFVEPQIDIRPGESNDLNAGSNQQFPVAVLTTQDAPIFDATQLDPTTVRFGPTGAIANPKKTEIKDVDGDGDLDLRLSFRIRETGIACGDISAELLGQTFAGTAIAATDTVITVGCP
jgi:hypothetical protein